MPICIRNEERRVPTSGFTLQGRHNRFETWETFTRRRLSGSGDGLVGRCESHARQLLRAGSIPNRIAFARGSTSSGRDSSERNAGRLCLRVHTFCGANSTQRVCIEILLSS
jgi:hypothetical protein